MMDLESGDMMKRSVFWRVRILRGCGRMMAAQRYGQAPTPQTTGHDSASTAVRISFVMALLRSRHRPTVARSAPGGRSAPGAAFAGGRTDNNEAAVRVKVVKGRGRVTTCPGATRPGARTSNGTARSYR